ncbi:MAG: hypothetical protein LC772_12040 [Chloroflexi bacterium]|nr:hypothetical protein [Chloroflexota bacterium]
MVRAADPPWGSAAVNVMLAEPLSEGGVAGDVDWVEAAPFDPGLPWAGSAQEARERATGREATMQSGTKRCEQRCELGQ